VRLDHVVHAAADLDRAAETFRHLGFHVVPGGSHPQWGTHNALIYFDLTYIELVAVQDRSAATGTDFGGGVLATLRREGEGPATVALEPADIGHVAAQLNQRGLTVNGPQPGSRRRPDGSVVSWQIAMPPWPRPFLIQWDTAADERRADLASRGALDAHSLGAGLRLRQVAWAVDDLVAAAAELAGVYGLKIGEPYTDDELGARCAAAEGGILLCTPLGAGPAERRLRERGVGPFLYEITGPGLTPRLIPPDEALGAWIRLQPEVAL
jgi:hypothetical protein